MKSCNSGICQTIERCWFLSSRSTNPTVFCGIKIAERPQEERSCGIWIVDIETGATVGFVKFEEAVQEIFAVQVLHNARFPELVNEDKELLNNSFILPDAALPDVPATLQDVRTA